jgi:peroxiredoxin
MNDLFNVDWSKIPAPRDDGAARHLPGQRLPSLPLPSTRGGAVDLAALPGRTVVYVYPMTGRPDAPLPDGWDMIPGARGCTPQACAFRDHYAELRARFIDHLFGLSTQGPAEQSEAAARLHLPFALLSDAGLRFANALALPRFETAGRIFLKRLTMVIEGGIIRHVIYPVFPPDRNAEMLMAWLSGND